MACEQCGHTALIRQRYPTRRRKLHAIVPHESAHGGIAVLIVEPGVGSESNKRSLAGHPDELAADDAAESVTGIDDPLVELAGVGDGGESVDAAEAEARVKEVAHLQHAQGVTFQVDVEAAARDRRMTVNTRVTAQPDRYLDAASG